MSLLTIVQYVCGRQNLTVPSTVIGSTDEQVLQLRRLLEDEGQDLSARAQWQVLQNQATLTTTATESQGLMSVLAPNGFRFIINNTIWSRTRRLPVSGPMDAREWQELKAMFVNGPYYRHRIRGNELLVNPTPPAGEDWAFEYVSYNWIVDSVGTTYKRYFTDDTDEPLLDEGILISGLRWRWKKEKGLDYAEDFRTYESQIQDAIGRDGGKKTLQMDGTTRSIRPGIWVAPGTWPL